jgi:hypothetical protein
MRTTIGLALGIALVAVVALAKPPGPRILHLGPVVPTPAPSPKSEEKVRLISSFTMQNKPDGESIITFEATDFALSPIGDHRVLANALYTLLEPKPNAKAKADEIFRLIRELEDELLEFVELTGPPKVRQPLTEQGPSVRPN